MKFKWDLIIKDNNISDTINKINKNNIPIEIKKNVSSTLDLRGERYESASDKIDKFLDDAIYANLSIVSIIHGFGTGVIRKLVHDKLKNNKNIISYRYGGSGEGGQGVTIVTLKE